MKTILVGGLVVLGTGLVVWLGMKPCSPGAPAVPASRPSQVFRIGLIPERDIFSQRKHYRVLADYLSARINRPVELVTVNSYHGVLKDFEEKNVDAAFLGSLVAVLTVDRLGAQVLVRPEMEGGISTYCGVIFVPADSPIQQTKDLAGHSMALVRTTTGGNLFPIDEMIRYGILEGPKAPKLVWVGTHDEAIMDVMEKRVEAGAVKNLRLNEFEKMHPNYKIRRLSSSGEVPENALVIRGDLAGDWGSKLSQILLGMDKDPEGQKALKEFGAVRFIPTRIDQYKVIYDIIERLGSAWNKIGVDGSPPHRPE